MRNFRGIVVTGAISLLIVTYPFLCSAEANKLPVEYQKTLQEISNFHDLSSTKDLPLVILALCIDQNGRMANPGETWEATDVISDESLPRKRLIWAATQNNLYVVHYERGGYAHSFHFLIAKMETNGSATIIWRGVGTTSLKNFSDFVSALKTNQIDDRLDYSH